MIDINKPIQFYDDTDGFSMDLMNSINILYNGENVCVCRTDTGIEIVFDKESGAVLTPNYSFWYAQNTY